MEISKWPEPYKGMIHDLTGAIEKAKANYLVGLGLFCYSEIVGRNILKNEKALKKNIRNSVKCFNLFLGEYMGYKRLLNQHGNQLYGWFRDGLCHEGRIKGVSTGVFVHYSWKTSRQGIFISEDKSKKILVVRPYLRDFKKGVKKFLEESNQI